MTTYFEQIRQLIYFEFNCFKDISNCFDYYWNKEVNPQKSDTADKFGLSHTSWDFQTISKE